MLLAFYKYFDDNDHKAGYDLETEQKVKLQHEDTAALELTWILCI